MPNTITAVDDAAQTEQDQRVTVPVLDNDIFNGQTGVLPSNLIKPITVAGVTEGASVVVNADGTVAYTPPEGFSGTDSFTYTIEVSDNPLSIDVYEAAAFTAQISADAGQVIDWGDGTSTVHTGGLSSHTYAAAVSPVRIRVSQTAAGSYINKVSVLDLPPEAYVDINDWGDSKYLVRPAVFNVPNLRSVPATKPPGATELTGMFSKSVLESDITGWDVSAVTRFDSMFSGSNFNQDISGWNTAAAVDMAYMFDNATAFNQDLSRWCVTNITTAPADFDSGATAWSQPRPVWGTCPTPPAAADEGES